MNQIGLQFQLQTKRFSIMLLRIGLFCKPILLQYRKIDVYNSEKKAKTFAAILQRGIRKDARGTLKTNQDAINFCDN